MLSAAFLPMTAPSCPERGLASTTLCCTSVPFVAFNVAGVGETVADTVEVIGGVVVGVLGAIGVNNLRRLFVLMGVLPRTISYIVACSNCYGELVNVETRDLQ